MPVSEYIKNMRAKIGTDPLFLIGAAAIVINDAGEVLLQRRSDNGLWWIPGGAVDPGEEPADAVVREVWEETGLIVTPVKIVGVFGGPELYHKYPNGDEAYYVSVTFRCRPIGGEMAINDDESLELRFFPRDQLPSLPPQILKRITLAFEDAPGAYFRQLKPDPRT